MLAEAGYPGGGFEVQFDTLSAPAFLKLAETVQAQLSEIGIDVKINVLETGAYIEKIFAGNIQLGIWGSKNETMDPNDLYKWLSPESGTNIAAYTNEEFGRLLNEGIIETDPVKREKIYKEAVEILKDDAVQVPGYYVNRIYAYQKGLKGFVDKEYTYVYINDLYWE